MPGGKHHCNSRSFDVFGRWGGEEFVGIIRNIDADTLLHIAERFRLLVENSYIQLFKERFQPAAPLFFYLMNDLTQPAHIFVLGLDQKLHAELKRLTSHVD